MSATENQFSLTRAASKSAARQKTKFLSVTASVESTPQAAHGKELPPGVLRGLKKCFQRENVAELTDGAQMFSALRTRFAEKPPAGSVEEAFEFVDRVYGTVLRENPTFSATVPVVLEHSDKQRPELVASAVLVRIADRIFLLTAAHVTDRQREGSLLIPGRIGFMPATGNFAAMDLPASGRRAQDKLDVAYFWLDDDCSKELDPSCTILERRHLALGQSPLDRTLYTFAGFPWRKSRVKGVGIETDFSLFTGAEAPESEYKALGLARSHHIAMRFHRKHSFHRGKRRAMTAPRPEGMSGGGVYAWDEAGMKKPPIFLPLAGIANEFVEDRSLLIATRLHVYVSCIFQNEPELALMAGGRKWRSGP